jgi:hypothetical protein
MAQGKKAKVLTEANITRMLREVARLVIRCATV